MTIEFGNQKIILKLPIPLRVLTFTLFSVDILMSKLEDISSDVFIKPIYSKMDV